jgi:lactobin A/cerein 7B family class IIb bacteriocin
MCTENEEIRKKAKEIGIGNLDGQIAHAKSLGLEFSKEDAEALAKEAGLEEKDELSEEDLKKVAGGAATLTCILMAALGAAAISAVGSAGILANRPGW